MKPGDPVVRVSTASEATGKVGDLGKILRIYTAPDETAPVGFDVLWDHHPEQGQYVAAFRIVTLEQWSREQKQRGAAAI